MSHARIHFQDGLEMVIPRQKRKEGYTVRFTGRQTAKHLIESIGVPHAEFGRLLVNGAEIGPDYRVQDGDELEVYPAVPAALPSEARFVLDTHLGRLAAYLRMLGFDCLYDRLAADETLARISSRDGRILLTRDRGLLKRVEVTQGFCILDEDAERQAVNVLKRYQLTGQTRPFTRCLACNSRLENASAASIQEKLPPRTSLYYQEFQACPGCGKIYWKGSHYKRMEQLMTRLLEAAS